MTLGLWPFRATGAKKIPPGSLLVGFLWKLLGSIGLLGPRNCTLSEVVFADPGLFSTFCSGDGYFLKISEVFTCSC